MDKIKKAFAPGKQDDGEVMFGTPQPDSTHEPTDGPPKGSGVLTTEEGQQDSSTAGGDAGTVQPSGAGATELQPEEGKK